MRVYSLEVGKPARAKQNQAGVQSGPEKLAAGIVALIGIAASAGISLAPTVQRLSCRQPRREPRVFRSWFCPLPIWRRCEPGLFRRRRDRELDHRPLAHARQLRDRAEHRFHLQGQGVDSQADRPRTRRSLCAGGKRSARREPHARQRAADRRGNRQPSCGRIDSRKPWPISSTCRTRSWRGWRTRLGYELVRTEAEKDVRSKSPDAVDLTMRGWALVWQEQQQQRTKENNDAAQALFEQALKIDPNEPDALAGDAYAYFLVYSRGWTTAGTDYEAKILGQADRAIALAPDNVWAYNVKSLYLTVSRRADEGLSAADAGLAINPDDPPLYGARGSAELALGRYEQAISDVQQAIRLSPRDPRIGLWLVIWVTRNLASGIWTRLSTNTIRQSTPVGALISLTGLWLPLYALDGKMEEAASALARGPPPQSSAHASNGCDNPLLHRDIPPLLEGLRKAGLAEE